MTRWELNQSGVTLNVDLPYGSTVVGYKPNGQVVITHSRTREAKRSQEKLNEFINILRTDYRERT